MRRLRERRGKRRQVKPPTSDGITSWRLFYHYFEAVASHKDWTSSEKATD
jgi:hypothetical protein